MAGERSERAPAQTLDQRLRALRQANEKLRVLTLTSVTSDVITSSITRNPAL